MTAVAAVRPQSRRLALGGGAVFMASAALVHAGNYTFNVVLGRMLGPALFAEITLIVTFMLIVTFAASTVQTTAAKFAAVAADDAEVVRLHRWLLRSLLPAGAALAVALVVAAPWLARLFRLSSAIPLVLFAAGIPIYLVQAVHRGVIQGEQRFGLLAGSYQAEMWVRLLGGVGLVVAGLSVAGAAGALTLSFIASWLMLHRRLPEVHPPSTEMRRRVRAFAVATALLLAGEMLIGHSDLIIAKLTLDPVTAGGYAAVSLIGRIAFFGTWPVVAFIFPIAARRHASGDHPGRLLGGAVAFVAGVSLLLTIAAMAAPLRILETAFGAGYGEAAPWLAPYTAATGCFAVATTVFSYHLARGLRTGAVIGLGAGVAQVLALALLHGSAATLVWVQLVLMAALLAAAACWHLRVARR